MLIFLLLPISLASLSFPYILTIAYVEIDRLAEHPMWFHKALSEYSDAVSTSSVSPSVCETLIADKYSKLLCPAWDVPFISPALNYFYPTYNRCDSFLRHLFVKRRFLASFHYLNGILKPEVVHKTGVLMDYPLYIKKFEHLSQSRSNVEYFFVYELLSQVLQMYEVLIKLAPTHVASGYPLLLDTISKSFHKHSAQILERRFPLRKHKPHGMQLPVTKDILSVLPPKWHSHEDSPGEIIKKITQGVSWRDVSVEGDFSKYFTLYAISCYYSLRRVVPNYTSCIQASNNWIPELINDLIGQRLRHSMNSKVQSAYTKYMESLIISGLISKQFSIHEASILNNKMQLIGN